MNDNEPLAGDILHGAAAIADFLGLDRRTVYHALSKSVLPCFRLGATVCARKSTLRNWIAAQEARAA